MSEPEIQPETTRYQCRHIFTDGHRCASPALRHEPLCYYHHTTRKPVKDLAQRRAKQSAFTLPPLEDRSAIQQAIGEVLQRIAANDLDPRRAGLLLYGLQIASLNLPKPTPPDPQAIPPTTIEEITHDPELGPLAPPAPYKGREPEKDYMTLLNERWARKEQEDREEAEAARIKAEEDAKEVAELLENYRIRHLEAVAEEPPPTNDHPGSIHQTQIRNRSTARTTKPSIILSGAGRGLLAADATERPQSRSPHPHPHQCRAKTPTPKQTAADPSNP